MANAGEKFVALDEQEYALDDKSLGICDDDGIQCLGGIMGGLAKGVSEDTQNVFLECALFAPECIARTGRKFQIDSDSRYRYERWVDPCSNVLGSDYATQMIVDICGGEVSEMEVVGSEDCAERVAYLRPERIKNLIGIDIEEAKIVEILNNLGFHTSKEGDKIKAISPTWRGDIEGEHDLVEEVVRMVGLDKIPAVSLPNDILPAQTLTTSQRRIVTVKHELASRGMLETVTWSFTDSKLAELFRKNNAPVLLHNPIAADLDEMRPSVLPNLLLAVKNNISRGYANLSLFEVGPEFFGRKPMEQQWVAGGVRSGMTSKKDWTGCARSYDVFDAKADALAVIAAANGPWDSAQISTDAPEYYHPGRSGALRLGKNVIAYFGELHPLVTKKFGIKQRVYAFEVFLDKIPLPRGAQSKSKKKLELSLLQAVDKDFAFVVDKSVKAADLLAAVKVADREHIADVRIFDVYEGENLPQGKKSVAVSVTFQPKDKTFSEQELAYLMERVESATATKYGAELRK